MTTPKLTPQQTIAICAKWEQQRRAANKGKAADEKTPPMAKLTGKELELATTTGRIEVLS
jgi:hypothetical protein